MENMTKLRSNGRPDEKRNHAKYADVENDRLDTIDEQSLDTEAFVVLSVDYSKFDIREVLNACSCNDCIAACSHLVSGGDYALELRARNNESIKNLLINLYHNLKGITHTDVYMSGSRIYPLQA